MPDKQDARTTLAPLIKRRGVRATARRIGVHHAMLVDWMAGKRDIGSDVMLELLTCLGLKVEIKRYAPASQTGAGPDAHRRGSPAPGGSHRDPER